jgi:hypothetical protein
MFEIVAEKELEDGKMLRIKSLIVIIHSAPLLRQVLTGKFNFCWKF